MLPLFLVYSFLLKLNFYEKDNVIGVTLVSYKEEPQNPSKALEIIYTKKQGK